MEERRFLWGKNLHDCCLTKSLCLLFRWILITSGLTWWRLLWQWVASFTREAAIRRTTHIFAGLASAARNQYKSIRLIKAVVLTMRLSLYEIDCRNRGSDQEDPVSRRSFWKRPVHLVLTNYNSSGRLLNMIRNNQSDAMIENFPSPFRIIYLIDWINLPAPSVSLSTRTREAIHPGIFSWLSLTTHPTWLHRHELDI